MLAHILLTRTHTHIHTHTHPNRHTNTHSSIHTRPYTQKHTPASDRAQPRVQPQSPAVQTLCAPVFPSFDVITHPSAQVRGHPEPPVCKRWPLQPARQGEDAPEGQRVPGPNGR